MESIFVLHSTVHHCGRVERFDITYDAKHSVLLPKKIHFTEIVIFYFDIRVIQIDKRKASNSFKSEFWIFQEKSTMHGVIPKILVCSKRTGKLYICYQKNVW